MTALVEPYVHSYIVVDGRDMVSDSDMGEVADHFMGKNRFWRLSSPKYYVQHNNIVFNTTLNFTTVSTWNSDDVIIYDILRKVT